MESKLNRKIRELLEKFGVKTDRVIGEWRLEGHLKFLVEEESRQTLIRELEGLQLKDKETQSFTLRPEKQLELLDQKISQRIKELKEEKTE